MTCCCRQVDVVITDSCIVAHDGDGRADRNLDCSKVSLHDPLHNSVSILR